MGKIYCEDFLKDWMYKYKSVNQFFTASIIVTKDAIELHPWKGFDLYVHISGEPAIGKDTKPTASFRILDHKEFADTIESGVQHLNISCISFGDMSIRKTPAIENTNENYLMLMNNGEAVIIASHRNSLEDIKMLCVNLDSRECISMNGSMASMVPTITTVAEIMEPPAIKAMSKTDAVKKLINADGCGSSFDEEDMHVYKYYNEHNPITWRAYNTLDKDKLAMLFDDLKSISIMTNRGTDIAIRDSIKMNVVFCCKQGKKFHFQFDRDQDFSRLAHSGYIGKGIFEILDNCTCLKKTDNVHPLWRNRLIEIRDMK